MLHPADAVERQSEIPHKSERAASPGSALSISLSPHREKCGWRFVVQGVSANLPGFAGFWHPAFHVLLENNYRAADVLCIRGCITLVLFEWKRDVLQVENEARPSAEKACVLGIKPLSPHRKDTVG